MLTHIKMKNVYSIGNLDLSFLKGKYAYKKEMTSIILKSISAIYPNIDAAIEDVFTATSLTFKDEFLSTEGSMYGIKMPLGRVSTKITNLYLGGQNCYLHGIYGTVRTALETIKLIEKDDD